MYKRLRHYFLALVSLVIGLVLTLLTFVLQLDSGISYSVFATSTLITLAIASFEMIIGNAFAEQLRPYHLLEQIEDKEFHNWGRELIADLNYKLQLLGQGEFRSSFGVRYESGRLGLAREKLQAVYLGTVYQSLGKHSWQHVPEEKRYYGENLSALKRNVAVTRVFILRKSLTVQDGVFRDTEIVAEMMKQQKDGIAVRIAWEDELGPVFGSYNILKDFIILDDFEVDARNYTTTGQYDVIIIKNQAEINRYQGVYYNLWKYSLSLEEFLKSARMSA